MTHANGESCLNYVQVPRAERGGSTRLKIRTVTPGGMISCVCLNCEANSLNTGWHIYVGSLVCLTSKCPGGKRWIHSLQNTNCDAKWNAVWDNNLLLQKKRVLQQQCCTCTHAVGRILLPKQAACCFLWCLR